MSGDKDVYSRLGRLEEGMSRNTRTIEEGVKEIKDIIKSHSDKMEKVDKDHDDRIAELERVVGRLTLKLGAIITAVALAASHAIEYVIQKFFN